MTNVFGAESPAADVMMLHVKISELTLADDFLPMRLESSPVTKRKAMIDRGYRCAAGGMLSTQAWPPNSSTTIPGASRTGAMLELRKA